MRTWISLFAIAFIGASLLASSAAVSIAFVVAAIVLAGGAVGSYVVGELRTARPSRAAGPSDMAAFTRRIPVDHVEPPPRGRDHGRHPHTV